MPGWAIWALAAAALTVGELLTPGLFFLGPVAVAAVLALVVALIGGGALFQVLVFIAASIGSVAFLRPIARRHLHVPTAIRTGTAALEGAKGIVLQQVDSSGGRVRLGGEEWSARAFFDDQVIEPGTRVEVVKIEGATALVVE